MVGQQILDLFIGVRVPAPQLEQKVHRKVAFLFKLDRWDLNMHVSAGSAPLSGGGVVPAPQI